MLNTIIEKKILVIYIKIFVFLCSQISFILLSFFTEFNLTWIIISFMFVFLSYSVRFKEVLSFGNKRTYMLGIVLFSVIIMVSYILLLLLVNTNSSFFLLITILEVLFLTPKLSIEINNGSNIQIDENV